MSICNLHSDVLGDYRDFVRSFFTVADERTRQFIDGELVDEADAQELLTLTGTGVLAEARWTADGDAILAGAPWQAWLAPSWEEIAAAEAKENAETRQP